MIVRIVDVPPEHSLSAEASRWVIDGIEVTFWPIDSPGIDANAALENLSAEEMGRADRYLFPADRRRCVRSHLHLRRELAARLGCAASHVEFGASSVGKPCLAGRWADAPLCFNLSRSAGLAAVAVSEDREVGVDIEAVRPIPNNDELVQRCLSYSELAEYRAEPSERSLDDFFQQWTRKEAALKAAGVGLRCDPRSLHVGLAAERVPLLLDIGDSRWRIHAVGTMDGYRAAAAIEVR